MVYPTVTAKDEVWRVILFVKSTTINATYKVLSRGTVEAQNAISLQQNYIAPLISALILIYKFYTSIVFMKPYRGGGFCNLILS